MLAFPRKMIRAQVDQFVVYRFFYLLSIIVFVMSGNHLSEGK